MAFHVGSAVRVLRKELREGLRDRSLVISVILVPAFLYPILGFGGYQIAQIIEGISQQRVTTIATGADVPGSIVRDLSERERIDVVAAPPALDGFPFPEPGEYREGRVSGPEGPSLDAMLLWSPGPPPAAALYFDDSRDRSRGAADRVREAIEEWRREHAILTLGEVGLGQSDWDLWDVVGEDTASAEEQGRKLLSVLLPMFLLLMLTTGTFYSTLDAVVGERERGTLETILVAPVRRVEVLVGKFAFVVLASMTALLLNLVSLTLFVSLVLDLLDSELTLTIGPAAFGLILVTALLTACVISAVFMVATVPMRTYREGQAALTPAYFFTMIPGFVVAISKQTFGLEQAFVPFLNTVALFKSVLLGEFPVVPILVTLGVLAGLTVVTLAFASRIMAREDVFLNPLGSLRSLFGGRPGGAT